MEIIKRLIVLPLIEIFSLGSHLELTNHIHILARSDKVNLPAELNDFQKFTASQIIWITNAIPESRHDLI